ncbi:MAG: formimidoylglutamate deiminase [Actinobacteria bacterium]|nr:formimidoylglutamate deiminase [Actinomycetota bacterium]
MKRIWCEWAWLGGARLEPGVLLELEGERIASVGAAVTAPAGALALPGYTLPGLANAHSHAFQRAFRGRAEGAGGDSFWSWRELMYEAAGRLDPDRYRALARATFGEMALAGVTAVGEFHYVHHDRGGRTYADPNEIGKAVVEAAAAAGIRITLIDTCYLRGAAGESLGEVQRRFADRDAEAWAQRVEELAGWEGLGAGARLGAAIHSVRAVDREAAATVAAFAAARELPLHAHVSEQPRENEECLAEYGLTPTALLAEAGALGERFTAVHATHLSDDDRRLLGEAGACCCLCPTTERALADGIGAAAALRAAGASLAVGSDSQAVIDLFEEARAIELDERLASGERGRHSAAELAAAATVDGHAAIGWPQAGAIAPGRLADLVNLGADGVRLAGAEGASALDAIVFAATAPDVANVVVGAELVVGDGAHTRFDVAAELGAAIAALGSAP